MRAPGRFAVLTLGLLLVVPLLAQAQQKGKGSLATENDYKQLATQREVTAKLISTDGKTVSFRIEIQVPQVQPNQPRPNPRRRPGQRPQLPRPPQVRFTTESKDFDLPLTEDAKFRTMVLPARFDEKGNPKTYTAQEKQELKGKENLPGYTSAPEDMKNGQVVKLTLVRPKRPANAKEKDEVEPKPSVSQIMVLQDGPELPGTTPRKKGK